MLTPIAVETNAVVSLHWRLEVLSWRRWSEEWRIVVRVRWWEVKHHRMIHGRAIMMMFMMLMVIHVADVHVVAHGASGWVQRERLGVVVREARYIWPVTS